MTVIKRTVGEVLLVVALGCTLGFAANTVRGSGSIRWSKNYFATDVVNPDEAKSASPDVDHDQGAKGNEAEIVVEPKGSGAGGKLQHNYQTVSLDDVVAILDDPATEDGLNVFIDARTADVFAEGHIPGAFQCFPFEIEKCIDQVLEHAEPADKVVVYCNGGDCEDSIFMCRELIAAGLARSQVYLYAGGWKEWEDSGQPIEKGQ